MAEGTGRVARGRDGGLPMSPNFLKPCPIAQLESQQQDRPTEERKPAGRALRQVSYT